MKKQLLWLVMLLLPMTANAYDIAVRNADSVTIYYNYINNGAELAVTCELSTRYTGSVVIPEDVTYENITRKVTSIGSRAFYGSSYLTSVIIPDGVTSIGRNAFEDCCRMTSITIPNSMTTIGDEAFSDCI